MPTTFSPVTPRALIRAKHVTELQDVVTALESQTGQVIDARARGAVGDGTTNNTTILNEAAAEAASLGAILYIPDGTYRGSIDAVSNLHITGTGTLKAVAGLAASKQAVIRRESSAENIAIEGVTVDGNGEVSGVKLEGVTGASVRHARIINTGTADNYSNGVRAVNGSGITVEGCTFDDVETAVSAASVADLAVLFNDVLTSRSNAFSYAAYTSGFGGCRWIGNRARDVNRMGLELISGGSSGYLIDPLVAFNDFALASSPVHSGDAMGMSVVAAEGARLVSNTVAGTIGANVYGYEVGAQVSGRGDAALLGNMARGFGTAYVLNGIESATLRDNAAIQTYTGIKVVTTAVLTRGIRLLANTIRGFRDEGINVEAASSSGIYGGHLLTDNQFFRDRTWSGDGSRQFNMLKFEGIPIPFRVAGNRGYWTESSPTSGLEGRGIFTSAGWDSQKGTTYDDNVFYRHNSNTFYSFYNNAGGGTINDTRAVRTFTVDSAGAITSASDWNEGFFGVDSISKPTVTGSRGSNAALASLLTKLADMGLITDSSS